MKTCGWVKNHYRAYIIFDASMPAVEYIPGCLGKPEDVADTRRWQELPKFCPYCGGKTKVAKRTRGK